MNLHYVLYKLATSYSIRFRPVVPALKSVSMFGVHMLCYVMSFIEVRSQVFKTIHHPVENHILGGHLFHTLLIRHQGHHKIHLGSHCPALSIIFPIYCELVEKQSEEGTFLFGRTKQVIDEP